MLMMLTSTLGEVVGIVRANHLEVTWKAKSGASTRDMRDVDK